MKVTGLKLAFGAVVVASASLAAYGCGDDDAGSATTSGGDAGGSDAASSSDTGPSGTDSGSQDSGSDSSAPLTCDDKPDSGTNPTCGVVGPCGAFVTPTTDATNDVPTGTSTTFPTGTYILISAKLYKLSYNVQLKSTGHFEANGNFQSIQSVNLNGTPDAIDERRSGTYTVTGGVLQLSETCPEPDEDDPATFTVTTLPGGGTTVSIYEPVSSPPGAGVEQVYAVIP